jgi:xanthine dehydrogenase accessory factor
MTDAALRATARAWLAAGRAAMLVQVLEHRGSVPREAGARMLVAADALAGTVGGGHLELQAIERARARLAAAATGIDDWHVVLGPTLGQCCGGALTLRTQPLSAAALARWPEPTPLFWLQVHGAGHVGRAVATLLAGIDCHVQWVDERDTGLAERALAPQVQALTTDAAEAEVRAAPPGAYYLVLTHSHDLDLRIVEAVLKRGDFGWCGLIGSRSKRARFEHRLAERGIAPQTLARLTCPVGVPGIAGKQPEVIAIAIVAQLLRVASAAAGGPQQNRGRD